MNAQDMNRFHEPTTDDNRETRLVRASWDELGHHLRLRLGNHIAHLWWGDGAWVLSVPTMGLHRRSDDRFMDPEVAPRGDLGPDNVADAQRWAERMIPLRIAERRHEDDLAMEDLRAMAGNDPPPRG